MDEGSWSMLVDPSLLDELARPSTAEPTPAQLGAALAQASALAKRAFRDRDADSRGFAERLLYSIHSRTATPDNSISLGSSTPSALASTQS